ncbi:MAG: hypothetical protein U5K79_02045 [Cyclobacteriaceae bacterium]|nr:hypothetical protein [Cyclobacteriaceae bacterium]
MERLAIKDYVASISPNPTTGNFKNSAGAGTGGFVSTINNLDSDTEYYVKAYATNLEGTVYGKNLHS